MRDRESVRNRRYALCKTLADGTFHSGAELAAEHGMSRTAIWKHIQALLDMGLPIDSVHGKGYRIARPPEILDVESIKHKLSSSSRKDCRDVSIFFEIDSTNTYLLNESSARSIHGHAVLAEYQSQGRGRRGHQWQSPLMAGVNLSIGWRYEQTPEAIAVLSLAIGTACAEVLERYGITHLGLKWPNDILCQGKKLAGILIETRAESAAYTDVVLGIGLNIRLPAGRENSEYAWIDLASVCTPLPSRNDVIAELISSCIEVLQQLPEMKSRQTVAQWRRHECIYGRQAELHTTRGLIKGQVHDVDDTGALIMSTEEGMRRFTSGEIRLRVKH